MAPSSCTSRCLTTRPTVSLKTFKRRKLLLACLLMRRPKVLLMDEPAAGLINAEIDEIDQILRMLSKEMNIAVLIVEHRIELLETIADRVMVMDAGEIIAEANSLRSSTAPRSAPPISRRQLRQSDDRGSEGRGSFRRLRAAAGDSRPRPRHPSGERVGIVGLNGHGKTTLFYAIAGLTGWQRGSILLNGKQIGRTRSQGAGRYTHQIVRQGLAIMPQGDEIFHGLTVEEHLDSGAFTPEAWRTRKERKETRAGHLRSAAEADEDTGRALSGGERRMVSIGRGLMTDAKLYLSDEPSLGLAPKIGMAVMDALLAIDLKDSAMFIAEQNVALLEGQVDRIIGMHAGKLKGEASRRAGFVCQGQPIDGHRLRHHQRHHGRQRSMA